MYRVPPRLESQVLGKELGREKGWLLKYLRYLEGTEVHAFYSVHGETKEGFMLMHHLPTSRTSGRERRLS